MTQPSPGWLGDAGRVQGRLETAVKGRESAVDIYFCGRPAMIAQSCELLRSRGIGSDALLYERHG